MLAVPKFVSNEQDFSFLCLFLYVYHKRLYTMAIITKLIVFALSQVFAWYVWESKLHTQPRHYNGAAHLCLDLWMAQGMNRELGVACLTLIALFSFRAQIKLSLRPGPHEKAAGSTKMAQKENKS